MIPTSATPPGPKAKPPRAIASKVVDHEERNSKNQLSTRRGVGDNAPKRHEGHAVSIRSGIMAKGPSIFDRLNKAEM